MPELKCHLFGRVLLKQQRRVVIIRERSGENSGVLQQKRIVRAINAPLIQMSQNGFGVYVDSSFASGLIL